MSGRELFSDNKEKFASGFNSALSLDGGYGISLFLLSHLLIVWLRSLTYFTVRLINVGYFKKLIFSQLITLFVRL